MNKKSMVLALAFFASPLVIFLGRLIFHLPTELGDFESADFLMIGIYWISALLLLTRIKFAWAVCAVMCVIVTGLSAFRMILHIGDGPSAVLIVQFIFSLCLMCSLLLLMTFLDSTLFDRRDNYSILGAADRKNISIPVVLHNAKGLEISGMTTSLSRSGFYAEVSGIPEKFYLLEWLASIPSIGAKDIPVHFVEVDRLQKIRVQFGDIDFMTQWKLHQKIKNL